MVDAPVLGMQKLGILDKDKIFEDLELDGDCRLRIGVDFGTKSSSLSYDRATLYTPLAHCKAADKILKDYNGSHRIESVAAILQNIDDPQDTVLVFGAAANEDPSVTSRKLLGKIPMMKLDILYEGTQAFQDPVIINMLEDLQHQHREVLDAICNGPTQAQCRVQDPLSGRYNVRTIRSIRCVFREFLRYLLQSAKAHFASRSELQPAITEMIFAEKAGVAVSIPTISSCHDSTMDDLRELLHGAGFPKRTCLLSEAKSAAWFNLLEQAQGIGADIPHFAREQILIVADIGGATTDVSFVAPCRTGEDGSGIMLGELNDGVGPLNGSQKLNEMFKGWLRERFPGGVLQLAKAFQGSERDLLEAFAAGFEVKKWSFRKSDCRVEIRPHSKAPLVLRDFEGDDFAAVEDRIILHSSVMGKFFDEWLSGIINMLEECVNKVKQELEESVSVVIGLTGWGSLPPFVLEETQSHFGGRIPVQMMETKRTSAVAQGGFLQLTTQPVFDAQTARASFDIRTPDIYKRVICEGADLSDGHEHSLNGELCFRDSEFPVHLIFVVLRDEQYGSMETAGLLKLMISSLEQGQFQLEKHADGSSYVRIQYRIQLQSDELMPRLMLTVPYGGRFLNVSGGAGPDMSNHMVIRDLYEHFAHKGDDDARTIWNETQGKRANGTMQFTCSIAHDHSAWHQPDIFEEVESDITDRW
ncbi:hypothetical protein EDD36DRAFT_464993 [Exophiala viscosa]|uniref:Uncharacterized protein n=1 Tax=Exophiala viscosa TaxID=2486360 RepID=A0AAN6DWP8_9EURO|nr:hypothetical protein EDD36DRAFT_464993 [Exophiala viscosa]